MSFVSGKKKDPKFEYYISGIVALHVAGENLEPFTVKTLKDMHDTIQQRLHHLPMCTKQCSDQLTNVNWWCNTCKSWREKLEKFHRHPKKIDWRRMHSWLWPTDPSKVSEVFCGNNSLNPNLKDVSNIFTVWSNCREFDEDMMRKSQSLKNDRNDLFHNESSISCDKRDRILQRVKDLLNEDCIKETLGNHDVISETIVQLERENIWFNQELVVKSLKDLQENQNKTNNERFKNMEEKIEKLMEQMEKRPNKKSNWRPPTIRFWTIVILLISCFVTGIIRYNNDQGHIHVGEKNHGCLVENPPESLLNANFSMAKYLGFHTEYFYGRQWLYREVENQLLGANSTKHGTILIAEMGYGKTAFFANLVCANKNRHGIKLREHLAAYHMCRFDSRMTRSVGLFIHRLVAMLSVKLHNYTKFLNNDRTCLENYKNREECDSDMFGCFDHCILFPIKDECELNHVQYIIAIDALDECGEDHTNRFIHLLAKRAHQMPLWVRFFITANNMSSIHSLDSIFNIKPLFSEDVRNIQDISELLKRHSIPIKQNKDSLVWWNFQIHVINIAQNNTEGTPLNLEFSFDNFYMKHFARVFGNLSMYETGKQIFSIICASLEPIDEQTLTEIMVASRNDIGMKDLKKELRKIRQFMKEIRGKLHFGHGSITAGLLNENNPYSVNVERGHYDIAFYFINSYKYIGHTLDIADLLIHISQSSNRRYLIDLYKSMNTTSLQVAESSKYPPLYHRLVQTTNDGEVAKLAYHQFKDIDAMDNLLHATALYKAAAIGNLGVFTALVGFGADINFRINFPRMINVSNAMELIIYRQWDYGMLDISAMNGHIHIVKYIIKKKAYDFKKRNAAHLLPIHLACKFGHLEIVRLLHRKFNWMLDDACLYYSATEGFVDVAKYCLENGVTDKCLPCNTSMYWIRQNELRLQGNLYFHYSDVVLYDDWRFINCETALHRAVLGNKTDIVRLLISKRLNEVACHDRGGKSPFMLAIIHDYKEVGSILMNDTRFDPIDSCRSILHFENTSMLSDDEFSQLFNNGCPEGFSLAGMSALYDRLWFSDRINSSLEYYSDSRDGQGCHPLHYAACRGSMGALMRLSKTLNLTQLTCSNGSSLIHSAAVCGSIDAIVFLKQLCNKDVKDKAGRTPAMYAVMRKIHELTAEDGGTIVNQTLEVIREISITKHDIFVSDVNQRSLLHYAVVNGHYSVVMELIHRFPNPLRRSIGNSDVHGYDPVTYAVKEMERRDTFFISITASFSTKCKDSERARFLMSPVEYTIFKLFLQQSEKLIYLKVNYQRILIESVKKNRLQLFLSILRCVRPLLPLSSVDRLFRHLTEHDASGIWRLLFATLSAFHELGIDLNEDLTFLSRIKKQVHTFPGISTCKNGSSFSMIHYLALFYRDIYQINYLSEEFVKLDRNLIIASYFDHLQPKQFNECYDSDGFNILERAIQGGSKTLVKHLLDKGFTSKRQICELIRMATISDKFKKRSNFTWNSDVTERSDLKMTYTKKSVYTVLGQMGILGIEKQISQYVKPEVYYDELIEFMIQRFENDIPKLCMCSQNTINFSLVHYFAIQNFKLSLKAAVKRFGKIVLTCKNNQDFVPVYLANMFNSSNAIEYMETRNIELTLPKWDAEQFFIFSLQTKFYFDELTYKQCFPSPLTGRFNIPNLRRATLMVRCVRKFAHHLGVKSGRALFLMRSTKAKGIILNNCWILKNIKLAIVKAYHGLGTQGLRMLKVLTAEDFIIDILPGTTFANSPEYFRIPSKEIYLMRRACQVLNSTLVLALENKLLEDCYTINCNRTILKHQLDLFKKELTSSKSIERNCREILVEICSDAGKRCPNSHVNNMFNEIKAFIFRESYKLESIPQFHTFYHERASKVIAATFKSKRIPYRNFNHIRYTMRYIEHFLFNYANAEAISKAIAHVRGKNENIIASAFSSNPTGSTVILP